MKRCPTCNRSYADDTLSFCLQDGSQLVLDHDPEETVIARPPVAPAKETPTKENSHRVYQAIIALMILGGAGIGLYSSLNRHNEPNEAAQPSPEPSHTYDPIAQLLASQNANAKPAASPATNTNALPPSNQPAIPKIYGKAYGAARKQL